MEQSNIEKHARALSKALRNRQNDDDSVVEDGPRLTTVERAEIKVCNARVRELNRSS